MNSTSNHFAISSNDIVSELEIHLPPPQPTLHLSRAEQKPNTASRTFLPEALPTHSASASWKKRPIKDVRNSVRLPIPSSFVDDLLFRLNNDDSDDDDAAAKVPRSPKRSKECLRQKLQQCKSELQSLRPKASTDVTADDHPSVIVESEHFVEKVPNVKRKQQQAARRKSDKPKDKGTCMSEDADVNCNDGVIVRLASLNRDEGVENLESDKNSMDRPGEIAKLHDSKKSTKVARRMKQTAQLKVNNLAVDDAELNLHARPCDAAESNPLEEATKVVQSTERVAPSISDDPGSNMGTNGDFINGNAISEEHIDATVKAKEVTKAVRKTIRAAALKTGPLLSNEECIKDEVAMNLNDGPCDNVEANQLDEVTKVVRKTKRTARWKSEEPVDKGESNGWKLDLSQSDSAIEKSLIQRLRKLETITDLYDEQTDGIRRKLKKHRRTMWLKQQKSAKGFSAGYLPLDAGKNKPTLGRFLPDVLEFVQLDDALCTGIGDPPPCNAEIQRIQGNLFGKRKGATTASQPTFTQMIRGTKDPTEDQDTSMKQSDVRDVIENINIVDLLVDESDCSVSLPDIPSDAMVLDGHDETDTAAMVSTRPHLTLKSPPPKLHRVEVCQDPLVPLDNHLSGAVHATNQCAGTGSSIWDAFRYGMYDSSWDQWLMDTTSSDDHAAVHHLLELLDQSMSSPRRFPVQTWDEMQSPSCLSTRAQTLAGTLVEKVNSNAVLSRAVEHLNPDWKENIYFTLGQKDARDIRNALNNVRNTQQTLQRLKNDILSNLERQEMLLSVYEDTLQISLSRFDARNDPSSPAPVASS
jgi:hypothetical protein